MTALLPDARLSRAELCLCQVKIHSDYAKISIDSLGERLNDDCDYLCSSRICDCAGWTIQRDTQELARPIRLHGSGEEDALIFIDSSCINEAKEVKNTFKQRDNRGSELQGSRITAQRNALHRQNVAEMQGVLQVTLPHHPVQAALRQREFHYAHLSDKTQQSTDRHRDQYREEGRASHYLPASPLLRCDIELPVLMDREHPEIAPMIRVRQDPGGYKSMDTVAVNKNLPVGSKDEEKGLDQRHRQDVRVRSFFAVGRVFAMLWHENGRDIYSHKPISGSITFVKSNQQIFSHVRRMAVVKAKLQGGHKCTWSMQINIYDGRGISKPALHAPADKMHNHITRYPCIDRQQPSICFSNDNSEVKITEHGSNITHKPQPPPARMSPDDDDDDESYGFRRASDNRLADSGLASSGNGQREQESNSSLHAQSSGMGSKVDQMVLAEWRCVIVRVCGPAAAAAAERAAHGQSQGMPCSFRETSTGAHKAEGRLVSVSVH